MPNTHDVGDSVTLEATVTLRESGAATDPDDITLQVVLPDGSVTTVAMGSMLHPAVGSFKYNYPPTVPGTFKYRFEAVKNGVAMAAEQGEFYVQPAYA